MILAGLQLMVFGMGMVFVFLLFLIFLTFVMSNFLQRRDADINNSLTQPLAKNELQNKHKDDELVAVISSAIHCYQQKNQK
ncbi:MAG TPA: hypothetical protein ENJ60_00170 [Aeromonadales bacterium]|nr:hypothetical protein [Aeromonadales bacterium]